MPRVLSDQALRDLLPFIESVLAGSYESHDAHVTFPVAEESRAQAESLAKILGSDVHVENTNGAAALVVPKKIYEEALKPDYRGEPVEDRLERLLRHCGYGDMVEASHQCALQKAIFQSGRSR